MRKGFLLGFVRWATRTGGSTWTSVGLFVLRVGSAVMLSCLHGWGKLTTFGEKAGSFPDPLGIGSTASLTLLVAAEFFCSIAVLLGLLTRLTAIPPIIAMSVAAFVFHADDPWSKRELALLYLTPFVTLLFCGAGNLSADALIGRRIGAGPKPSGV